MFPALRSLRLGSYGVSVFEKGSVFRIYFLFSFVYWFVYPVLLAASIVRIQPIFP